MARNSAPAGSDRRVKERRRTKVMAWVSTNGYGTARCTIVNMSEDGAQIEAPVGLRVGDYVTLFTEPSTKRRACVMWIEADVIGLRFAS